MVVAAKLHHVSQAAALATLAILVVVWVENSTWQTVNGKLYFGVVLEIQDRTLYSAPPFQVVTATHRFGFLYMTGLQQGRPSTRILAPHWFFVALTSLTACWIWVNAWYSKRSKKHDSDMVDGR